MHIFLGGLFLFLLGLEGSKWGLERLTARRLESLLERLCSSLTLAVLTGILATAVLQSSSAVSIILISFLETGIIKLKPALGIMLGANIGTTITVQIISLPVLDYFPCLILLGLVLTAAGFFYRSRLFYLGTSAASFGLIFAGLELMTSFFNQAGPRAAVTGLLLSSSSILTGLSVGILVTAVIQSSSAVTGITVSLARSGLISLPTAVAVALGSNVGTCITAFLASLNCGKSARLLAWGHLFLNIIGVAFILPFINLFITIVRESSGDLLRQIANAHTFFNIINVFLFLPLLNTYIRLTGGGKNHV